MIKTVIFDLGGVLVRTDNPEPRRLLAEKFEMTYDDLSALVYGCESAELATRGAITAEVHKETVLKELELPAGTFTSFGDEFWAGDSLDSQLVEFIQGLQGEYTTVLLSNAWDDLRPLLVNLWKIDGIFDHIFISAELRLAKPDPAIFKMVLDDGQFNPSEVAFIDDLKDNVDAAATLGIHPVHLPPGKEIMDLFDEELVLKG